jgi:hypothetical protein
VDAGRQQLLPDAAALRGGRHHHADQPGTVLLLGQQFALGANAAQQGAGAVEGTQKKMARCRGPKARGVSAGGPVHRRGMVGAEGFGCAVKGFVAQ